MTAVAAPTQPLLQYRSLVDIKLWDRLVGRICKEHPELSEEDAAIAMEAGLGYLKLCADHPQRSFAPSETADLGWHTFMLYTRDYAAFCQHIAGRFLHHEPNDNPERPMAAGSSAVTVEFMVTHGIPFNQAAWSAKANGCTVDCDNGGGPTRGCTCS